MLDNQSFCKLVMCSLFIYKGFGDVLEQSNNTVASGVIKLAKIASYFMEIDI